MQGKSRFDMGFLQQSLLDHCHRTFVGLLLTRLKHEPDGSCELGSLRHQESRRANQHGNVRVVALNGCMSEDCGAAAPPVPGATTPSNARQAPNRRW